MHAHASDTELTEKGAAKFFVRSDGETVIQEKGRLNEYEIRVIQRFIKMHYKEMYEKWSSDSDNGFYEGG